MLQQMLMAFKAAAPTVLHTGTFTDAAYDGSGNYGWGPDDGWGSPFGAYSHLTGTYAETIYFNYGASETELYFSTDLNGTGNIIVTIGGTPATCTRMGAGYYTVSGDPWNLSAEPNGMAVSVVAA